MTDTPQTEAPERAPMPLDVLARQVFEDSSSDYNDGVGGWTTAVFNSATGVLTISYKRDDEMDPAWAGDDPDYAHGSAEYRFALVREGHIVVPAPEFAFKGPHDTDASMARGTADRIAGGVLPGSNCCGAAARLLRAAADAMDGRA